MAFFDEFQHLKIQLDEIKRATSNFADKNVIGVGGFGKVYKGSFYRSKCVAAFKRLDSGHGQGDLEFWKEIMMLSRYTHENLITLLGYCDEDGERILAYKHASCGSLDRHLSSTTLSWTQRLKICLEAARGLSYLHDPKETQERVLHRDIKSSNILLDENWNAKLSDLGLSKIGPANQQHSVIVTNAVGTLGYIDPLYLEGYFLTKESDVYSFGVVLFEVLCGRVCNSNNVFGNGGQRKPLVSTWIKSYEMKNLHEIIFEDLKEQMDPSSLEAFSHIAYQCLKRARDKRPTMAQVVGKLEKALEFQESYDDIRQSKDYRAMIKTVVPPLIYRSEAELYKLLSKGIVANFGKTHFFGAAGLLSRIGLFELIHQLKIPNRASTPYPNRVHPFTESGKLRFPESVNEFPISAFIQNFQIFEAVCVTSARQNSLFQKLSSKPSYPLEGDLFVENKMSREIICMGSESRPPVLVMGEYAQWKLRMIDFLDQLDRNLMKSIREGPVRPTVTIAEVPETDTCPLLPSYTVEKPYHLFNQEQRKRHEIDKRAMALLIMALPNDMYSRVDSFDNARDIRIEIEQQMQGGDTASEYQKESAMNAYEGFHAKEGEMLLDSY
ncbi:hypothetical protein OSB04_029030 [Centaurea solstitialis]|uniref:non-specific serine/threonine protein kinase n=1 Tax=Centaurea solstitialis TaxID=347529 RepID=A0AA38W9W4_9ASTR|nr:hypothetical protein OSB04_029030 [Centaurea solstitialis]